MEKKGIRKKGLMAIVIGLVLLVLFTCHRNEVNSKAHTQNVQLTERMESSVEDFEERLESVSDLIDEHYDHFKDLENPDSSSMAQLKKMQVVLATQTGVVEKYETLIELQKEYLKAHEKSALSADEINIQHNQIKENYALFQRDSASLVVNLNTIESQLKSNQPMNK